MSGVTVRLQRRSATTARYKGFATAKTNRAGDFSLRVKPAQTTFYRAVVVQTSQCLGAASSREKVTVRRTRR